jgi:RyR domain
MILVTGDVVLDHNIYAGQRLTPVSDAPFGTKYSQQPGGAMLVYGLLRALADSASSSLTLAEVTFGLQEKTREALASWPSRFHAGALWEPAQGGHKGETRWRLSKNLGYGPRTSSAYPATPADGLESMKPRVLVIDDGGLGFRLKTAAQCWPPFLTSKASPEDPRCVILKMSRPLAHGDLWRELAERWSDRLIVLVSADNLRLEDVRVTKGLSWESTVDDLIAELRTNPAIRNLRSCRYLVVTLRGDAALWLDEPRQADLRCCLVFDRERGEGERDYSEGHSNAFGFLSSVTAALAWRLWKNRGEVSCDLAPALQAGLSTTRFLMEHGHGAVTTEEPGFPFKDAAAHMQNPTSKYAVAVIQCDTGVCVASTPWTILGQAFHSEVFPGPLFGPARRLALLGPVALENVPIARFGRLLTLDRQEIEALRALRQLMLSYRDSGPQKQPLSLAVFGAPGSGKSFGIKQIAEAVFGEKNPILEFNLAQFRGPDDLIGSYHQIRDHVLLGKTPVVFWDEFDSRNYFWLQYLLAPMQDGVFQEGQHSHAIGKCIFVFAGGTSRDFAHFGPCGEPAENETETQRSDRQEFIMAKGPDFKSRLAGFLDVLGPNPRQLYNEEAARKGLDAWQDDPSDADFPLRRAVLLRSLLGLSKEKENERLEIDRGLLTALLEIGHYRNGARSVEKLASQMRERGGLPLRRAHLPPGNLLALYVDDVPSFHSLIRRSYAFLAQAEKLAPVLHQDWRDGLPPSERGGPYDVPYEELDQEGKEANLAAAKRIPEILAMAGFVLEDGEATPDEEAAVHDFLKEHGEFLAEEEHNGWGEQKRMEGWTYAAKRDNATRRHPLLVAYAELPEEQKNKDRRTILNYPKYARAAGFKIVSRRQAN